ncbi:MAG: carbamoyltransferase [Candidatus Levybacteria bacterium]|nr:carbamoyltransferase [Candidatus Levybacteria bacterium]
MYILGISCYYHDSAAALIKDGIVVACSDEERFSRIKHDSSFPKKAIQFCLEKEGITSKDLDFVVFYEKPFIKFERILLTSLYYAPKSLSLFRESMKEWFFDKLWVKSHIISELKIPSQKLLFSEHHLSHAASSFYCSPFKESAVLSIDAVGEWTTTSWGIAKGNRLDLKEEIKFPNSLGLLYSAFTVFAGYEANEGEYKLMGLAPYGKAKYKKEISNLIDVKKDGSFSLKREYFSYQYDLTGVYTKKFKEVFGDRNVMPDKVIEYYADIAASIQSVFEDMLLKIVDYIYSKTTTPNICFAGGVALNSKANWLILKKTKFKNLYIQPSAGDSGGAIGAGLYIYHHVLGNNRSYMMDRVYFGTSNDNNEIEKFLLTKKISFVKSKNDKDLIDQTVDVLSRGKVVGWVQSQAEWGPRALGHRSILADPRFSYMRDIVNTKIKFREAFRPFAPSVIEERADEFFDLGPYKNQLPLRFMQLVVPVAKKKRDKLGAVTHVDGTARPQLVDKETNPLYHRLIHEFGLKTGVPVLLNTSFNLKGEPIVNTYEDAYKTFIKSGIDVLVLGKHIIKKSKK